jgi:hypothetical protein
MLVPFDEKYKLALTVAKFAFFFIILVMIYLVVSGKFRAGIDLIITA